MTFSYSAVWDDVTELLRAHGSLIAALAGVFLFLPGLFVGHMLPQPQSADPAEMGRLWVDHMTRHWHWLLLNNLAAMVGAAAILMLIFRRGITVGGAIVAAFVLLPFYFLASLMTNIAIGLGILLLIVPGLYLIGRLTPVLPAMVAENRRNPIDAIGRGFELSKGHGWAILGLVLIVAVAAVVAIAVATWLVGILLVVVAGRDLAEILVLIVRTAGNAAMLSLMVVLGAAIYRRLAGDKSVAQVFE